MRDQLGRPVFTVVFSTSCPRCAGADGDCLLCRGTGEVEHDRCPASLADGAADFLRAYVDMEADRGLPAPGCLAEQAAAFADMVHLADAERGRIDREKREAGREARRALG